MEKTRVETSEKYTIGLDLGGTNSIFGVVDGSGNIKATTRISTQGYETPEDYVKASLGALYEIIETIGGKGNIAAMGIGAPGGNHHKNTIDYAANVSWAHDSSIPLADMFAQNLGVPVAITNDANAAALGEMSYGVAKGMKDFIVITLGTGVGSGIVLNGQMIYGCDGFAGELGHVVVERHHGRPCGCGREGCLETYCSATGVVRTAKEMLAQNHEDSILRNIRPEDLTSKDISIAASKGDALARKIYAFTGEMLGAACADFSAFCSPEAFIFFGGLTKAGELLMAPIRESYDKHVLGLYKGKAQFLLSGLPDGDAAVLGASAVGWEVLASSRNKSSSDK